MINKGKISDTKELSILENKIFDNKSFPISKSSFYYHIKNNHLFTYKTNNKITGYILWLKRKNYFRLYSLGIDKEFQGKGIAKKLLDYSFKVLKDKSYMLEVKCDNNKAISLYKKYGFNVKKVLKNYYPDLKDAYQMKKL